MRREPKVKPIPLHSYKNKGYIATLIGSETPNDKKKLVK
jgi:hypothetical protein